MIVLSYSSQSGILKLELRKLHATGFIIFLFANCLPIELNNF